MATISVATNHVRVIIAGGRDFYDSELLYNTMDEFLANLPPNTLTVEVVCGEAKGADTLGRRWAEDRGLPVKSFPADWSKYGNKAGPIRNQQMLEYATHLVAFWDQTSRGTLDMITRSSKSGMPTEVVYYGW